jgi:NTE family protein
MDIAIALGGGGARGMAHIGALRRLEHEGFRIRAVAGTSAGGIIATLYAAGYTPDEMEARFASIDQARLFGLATREGPAILGLSRAAGILDEFLGDRTFADLSIPCAVTAVDVKSMREVILRDGRVVDALMATIAIPAIFPPRQMGEALLVDGGVMDPVPVADARLLAPDLPVVAIPLSPPLGAQGTLMSVRIPYVPHRFVEQLSRFRLAQVLNVYIQAADAEQRMLTELRLQVDDPDVIIRPDVGDIGLLDVVDVPAVARRGEMAVDAALPHLKRATAWPNRLRHRVFPYREAENA